MRRFDPGRADDASLVARLATDAAALEEFYRRHVRPLTRYALRRLGDPDAAADLVAAAFLAVIESAHTYDSGRGVPGQWLFGIAGNLIASEHRRRATEQRALGRIAGQRSAVDDDLGRVDERTDASRRAGPLADSIDTLPAAERELVHLLVSDDLSVSDAAELLGIRPATARMRLSRARRRLGRSGMEQR